MICLIVSYVNDDFNVLIAIERVNSNYVLYIEEMRKGKKKNYKKL